MQDITLRAIEVLKNATLIAAEDTRHSKLLLDHIGVNGTRMISCHDHNEEQRVEIIKNDMFTIKEKVEKLIQKANDNGGKDNIGVSLLEVY